MANPGNMAREMAEHVAIQALGFLAADAERLGPFLAQSGIDPAGIRAAAREPHFLAGVLDHIASDERLLIAFAETSGLDPEVVGLARRALGRVWDQDTA